MIELVKTKLDLCVGCNRCIRECPMEMANVTYQDEAGNIKVKTDHSSCIGCGWCIAVCKHGAREYKDDTARFFEDLAAGVPISIIAAPSIQTNIPEYKRLFTYLKNAGVKKIYDASLGADICIWAHVRHIEENGSVSLITQPCPAIVLYSETYRHDLLKHLAPIHSPMACAAVYMKKYEGITDRIAAISPCIAKSAEFADTQLMQYNVTFEKLLEYLEENHMELPREETGFDHDESGLGALFPLPGGLKENIEYHLGRTISISKAEGARVYHKLDIYAETPADRLPDIFDVLSCSEGCNIGPAVASECNIFDIDAVMSKKRNAATDESRQKHFEALYQIYDKKFDRSHFARQYRKIKRSGPIVTDQDIERAFELLGKTDYDKQHVDCGACGSETCHHMARKIVLGVNIPINCIVKAMEDAKREHEENLTVRAHASYLEHLREADERAQIMLDTTPLGAQFWDKNFNVIDCNQETIRLFNAPSKQDYLENFHIYFPEYQPDGSLSREKSVEIIKKAFEEGYQRLEWMCQTPDGTLFPVEVILVRVDFKGDQLVAAYTRDLREQKQMMQEIDTAVAKLKAVIANYAGVIWSVDPNGIVTLFDGLYLKEIGVTPDFIEGKNIELALHKNRHQDIVENVQKTFTEGSQDWISDIDGKMFHARTAPIYGKSGDVTGVVGSIDDITETLQLQEELKTALKDAEDANQALQSAQLTMSGMFEANPHINILFNDKFEVIDCNPAAVRLMGFVSKEDMLAGFAERIIESVPPIQSDGRNSRPVPEMLLIAAKEGYVKFETELILIGNRRSLIIELKKIPYENSFAIVAYVVDITETLQLQKELKTALADAKDANQALKSAQHTTSAMFEANPHINILFNDKFEVIDCNPVAVQLMRFETKEEMLAGFAERITKSIPPVQSSGRVSRSITEIFQTAVTEGILQFETELILGGKKRNLSVEFKKIPYENSFAIVAYLFDITDMHERERELVQARQLNELQLTKLNLVVQATKIGLWEMMVAQEAPENPENTFMWSDEFRHMLGFSDETDFPNTLRSWSDRLHPEDKEKTIECFRQHLADKTGQTPFDVEYRLLKKNGEYAYYRASGETIRDKDGTPLRVAGSLMDITEAKNILLETEKQKIAAEAASMAKSDFLSKMSHEIRTPMNAILGITEIQLRNPSIAPETKEALDKIYNAGDLLLGIINDVLDLSKIESGKMELAPAKYDVASVINDVVTLNMMRIGSKEIEFILSVDKNTPATLFGDELRIKQVLNNILSNAIKYTVKGSVKLSVYADIIMGDDVVLTIEVKDTGLGMTEEQVSQMFDAYTRFNMEANRTTEGTGLGMNITRNLVHLMEGEIFVTSEINKGSQFTVKLPQKKIDETVLGQEQVDNLQNFRTNGIKQIKMAQIVFELMPDVRVLVVDDVESNLYVAKGLLAPYGMSVDTATSGYAAIDKIKAGNVYDIVFMDHMMPKMDGIETTKIIRGLGYEAPIVALTANVISGQSDIFLAHGFDGFVSKPIDVRLLNTTLKKFVRGKYSSGIINTAGKQGDNRVHGADGTDPSSMEPQLVEFFLQDAHKAVVTLEAICDKRTTYDTDDIRTCTINVHGMKSALVYVGESELSALAGKLEQAGRNQDAATLAAEIPEFLNKLRAVVEKLAPKEKIDGKAMPEDYGYLREKLLKINEACENFDIQVAKDIISESRQRTWSRTIEEQLGTMAEHLLSGDSDEVIRITEEILKTI